MQQNIQQAEVREPLAALYEQHAPSLLAYLHLRTSSWEEAEDLLVEVFLAALERASAGEMSEEQWRSWLWRVTRNKLIDYFRAVGRRPTTSLDELEDLEPEDEQPSPEEVALRREEYGRLLERVRELSPLQRQILQLRFVHGLRGAEIAKIVQKSEAAVRMLLLRTLNLLRSLYT